LSIMLDAEDPNIKEKLATLPEKMLDYAEEVLMNQAHLMVGLAQVLVPVDTGSLRDSIRVERGGEGMYWREIRVRAGGYIVNPRTHRLVDYAIYVEARTPFMEIAYLSVRSGIAEMIQERVVEKCNTE
jgi:hypothetical protein